MARYRAAIIGTGRIASLLERDPLRSKPSSHAGWYRQHPDIELVAGADIDPECLQAFGADWAISSAMLFADYREMLECTKPDLVSICAYAPQRLEMIGASVQAGARGLWIEKAIACSIREAEDSRISCTVRGSRPSLTIPAVLIPPIGLFAASSPNAHLAIYYRSRA